MIVQFTDFGLQGPYTGQMKYGSDEGGAVPIGVGATRPPIITEANGRWYVGPGNGLFELI
jgi:S-adenosyl-L-methionine hydrolase (adenosine-forming)